MQHFIGGVSPRSQAPKAACLEPSGSRGLWLLWQGWAVCTARGSGPPFLGPAQGLGPGHVALDQEDPDLFCHWSDEDMPSHRIQW